MTSLLYIVWTGKNELGIPIIDEQHRGIVTTINSFHYFINEGHGIEALKPTLHMLLQYTNIHFQTEEKIMVKAGYPDLAAHLSLHTELLRKTKIIAQEAASAKDPKIALTFLKEWWLDHINDEDRKYASYLKETSGTR